MLILNEKFVTSTSNKSIDISYDNKDSKLQSDNVQNAIDEINEELNNKSKVVANVETATENKLTTIEIDGEEYKIEGGSNIKNLPIEEYIELPEEEKKNGDLYLVDGGLVNSPFNMTNIEVLKQSNSMNATSSDTTTEVTWNGQAQIALQYYYVNKVDLTNCKYIFYDLSTKNCYGNGETSLYGWDVFVGISKTYPARWLDNGEDAFVNGVYNRYNLSNKDYLDEKLDVSIFSGEYYIVVSATGWNATIYNITLAEDKNSHNIYYNNNKYSGGEGGTEVIANPELIGDEDILSSIEIDGVKYKIQGSVKNTHNAIYSRILPFENITPQTLSLEEEEEDNGEY